MSADPRRCPSCAATLKTPGQARCEWCGAALPETPKPAPARADGPHEGERDRLAAVLEQMASRQETRPRSHGAGCLLFVLLLLAIAFVVFFTLTPRVSAPSPEPRAPQGPVHADPTPLDGK